MHKAPKKHTRFGSSSLGGRCCQSVTHTLSPPTSHVKTAAKRRRNKKEG